VDNELGAVEPDVLGRVTAGVREDLEGSVVSYAEMNIIWIFCTGIHKIEARLPLLLGRPRIALVVVANRTGVIQIFIGKFKIRKSLLGAKVIRVEVSQPSKVALVDAAISASVEKVAPQMRFVILVMFAWRWRFFARE
jgi:hypothetical protein